MKMWSFQHDGTSMSGREGDLLDTPSAESEALTETLGAEQVILIHLRFESHSFVNLCTQPQTLLSTL